MMFKLPCLYIGRVNYICIVFCVARGKKKRTCKRLGYKRVNCTYHPVTYTSNLVDGDSRVRFPSTGLCAISRHKQRRNY